MSLKQLYIHVATEVLSLIPMPGPSHYSNVGLVTPSAGRVAHSPSGPACDIVAQFSGKYLK